MKWSMLFFTVASGLLNSELVIEGAIIPKLFFAWLYRACYLYGLSRPANSRSSKATLQLKEKALITKGFFIAYYFDG